VKILAAVDASDQHADVIALAGRLARASAGSVVVAHVYHWPSVAGRIGAEYEVTLEADARELAERAGARLGDVPYTIRVEGARSAAQGLHRIAADEAADVLVTGSSHRGTLGRVLFGTVGDQVLHGAPCPVSVAPRGYGQAADGDLRRIGVAYDAGAESRAALAWAAGLARTAGGTVTVLTVNEPIPFPATVAPAPPIELIDELREERRRELDEAVASLPSEVRGRGVLLEGSPAQALAGEAGDLDLLVCGSRSYGALGTVLLGSVARSLFHRAPCPVVALPRPAEADS
jgi:nucleotide-binding universal stress UspA family protein